MNALGADHEKSACQTGGQVYSEKQSEYVALCRPGGERLRAINANRYSNQPSRSRTVGMMSYMLRGGRSDEEYQEKIEARKKVSSLDRIGKPEDIANAVLFFASDEASFITGKTLLVDGGRWDFLQD